MNNNMPHRQFASATEIRGSPCPDLIFEMLVRSPELIKIPKCPFDYTFQNELLIHPI